MKPIGNLNGLRGTTGRTIDTVWRAVAADDLDARMLFKPAGEAGCRAVGQHVNWLMLLQINQQRSIGLAFAKGEIVDAQDARSRMRSWWGATDQSQGGSRTDGHTLAGSSPRSSFSTLVERQLSLLGYQALGAAGGGGDEERKAFGEHLARTGGIATKELAHVSEQAHGNVGPWQVGDRAIIVAVDRRGRLSATGAECVSVQSWGKELCAREDSAWLSSLKHCSKESVKKFV